MKKSEIKELEFEKAGLKSHGKFLQNFASKLRKNAATPLGVEIYNVKDLEDKPLTIREEMAEKTANAIRRALKFTKETVFYHMYGRSGIGKRTLVKRAAKLLNQNLVIIDLKMLKDSSSEQWSNIFLDTVRENESPKTILCLKNFHIFFEKGNENKEESYSIIEIARNYFGTVFVLSDNKIDDSELEKNIFGLVRTFQI